MKEKISIGTAQFGMNYGITNKRGEVAEQEIVNILNFCKITWSINMRPLNIL